MKKTLTPVALALLLLSVPAVVSPEVVSPEVAQEESEAGAIERILELQRKIDELTAALSPEAREELVRRLVSPAGPGDAVATAEAAPVEAAPIEAAPVEAALVEAPEPRPVRRRLPRRPHCNFLEPLDSNQDGKISALDRYWRHLHLWSDENGDGTVQDGEVRSAYDLDVREIALDLDTFIRKKGTIGEIRVGQHLTLDVGSDGGGLVLVVDATKIKRGDGPQIFSASGESLEGFQPFQEGWRIEDSAGQATVLSCP